METPKTKLPNQSTPTIKRWLLLCQPAICSHHKSHPHQSPFMLPTGEELACHRNVTTLLSSSTKLDEDNKTVLYSSFSPATEGL